MNNERICACALGTIFGFEPHFGVELVNRFGSAAAVFETDGGFAGRGSIGKDGGAALLPPKYHGRLNAAALERAAAELEWLRERGFGFIAYTEAAYPALLRECPDAPAGLYIRSETPAGQIFGTDAIAIVGTRDISLYGKHWTRRITETLALSPAPPMIISGLAFGVDISAHTAALDCGLPTIAVLPCGIDSIYPQAHKTIAGRIASTPGSALITDYPPATFPAAHTFVRRNRIIAGIARATIVIESKAKGGSLITARHAFDYNRDIFALPGRIEDPRSAGCNTLIRNHIADIITSPEELADSLGLSPGKLPLGKAFGTKTGSGIEEAKTKLLLTRIEQKYGPNSLQADIALAIRANRGISIDKLAMILERPFPTVMQTASLLNIDGIVSIDLSQRCRIADAYC